MNEINDLLNIVVSHKETGEKFKLVGFLSAKDHKGNSFVTTLGLKPENSKTSIQVDANDLNYYRIHFPQPQ